MPRKSVERPRDRGEGSVSKRVHADGSAVWRAQMRLPPDPVTGKPRRRSETYPTKEAAEARLRKWLVELDEEIVIDPTTWTVGQLAAHWLRDEKSGQIRPSTMQDYEATIATHLVPRIGTKKARDLTPYHVKQFVTQTHSEGGGRTAQIALRLLKAMLEWAVGLELLRRNVAKGVKGPSAKPEEAKAMSHAELRDFLTAAREDYYWPLWLVYATTGVRRGEGLGIRWQDVDLGAGSLSVRQQVTIIDGQDGKSHPTISQGKSKAAVRTIDIDVSTRHELSVHRERQKKIRKGFDQLVNYGLVFCTTHGTPHNPNNLYRNFARILTTVGLDPKEWNLHHLRHTHLTHCLLAGMPITEVARRAGHADPSITMSVYAHVIRGTDNSAALAAIEAALFNGERPSLP